MKDQKFIIALVIIGILVLVLAYVIFIGPRLQGYLVQTKVDAQQEVVKTIIQIVGQQGYIVLNDGDKSVVLIDNARLPQLQAQNATPESAA